MGTCISAKNKVSYVSDNVVTAPADVQSSPRISRNGMESPISRNETFMGSLAVIGRSWGSEYLHQVDANARVSCEAGGKSVNIDEPGVPVVLISDPGQDLDDELAYIMLRFVYFLGLVDVRGVIATLHPAFDRARLLRGTLDMLGLHNVPVGVGSDGGDRAGQNKAATFEEWAQSYMTPRFSERADQFEPGCRLLYRLYSQAEYCSIRLVIIASLKDPALFLRDNEELFVEKTNEVVIMGGVEPCDVSKDDVILKPDTAHNNEFDREAASFFYRRCQELGVRLIIVSRWAAYAAKVSRSCYDELAAMGSSIGCRLRNAQRASIESLWTRAASPPDSPERKGLPPRCDQKWFMKTFCNGADAKKEGRGPDDTIWDLVSGFMQYDTIALLSALPDIRARFFRPVRVPGLHGVDHYLIGRSESDHNVVEPMGLAEYLRMGFRRGLSINHRYRSKFILLARPRWNNRADVLVSCAMLRGLFELDVLDCTGIVVSIDGEDATSTVGFDSASEQTPRYRSSRSSNASTNSGDIYPEPVHDLSAAAMRAASFSGSAVEKERLASEITEVLADLGLGHVPVLRAVRRDTEKEDHDGENPDQPDEALAHLHYLYDHAPPSGVSVVVLGDLRDMTAFASGYPKLFRERTQQVVHIGGANVIQAKFRRGGSTSSVAKGRPSQAEPPEQPVKRKFSISSKSGRDSQTPSGHRDSQAQPNNQGPPAMTLLPDVNAHNNEQDMVSALTFYKQAQELLVPLVVLSRHFTQAVSIPRAVFDALGQHGGATGSKLCQVQKESTQELWEAACTPTHNMQQRRGLAPRCDREWFINNFCGGKPPDHDFEIWPSVQTFGVHSTLAMLAVLPQFFIRFAEGTKVPVRSVTHRVVGDSPDNHGVKDVNMVRDTIIQCLFMGVRLNSSCFELGIPPPIELSAGSGQIWTWNPKENALDWTFADGSCENNNDTPTENTGEKSATLGLDRKEVKTRSVGAGLQGEPALIESFRECETE